MPDLWVAGVSSATSAGVVPSASASSRPALHALGSRPWARIDRPHERNHDCHHLATTIHDAHGNEISGAAEKVEGYDQRSTGSSLTGTSARRVTSLVDDDPDFAMGLVLGAYLMLMSTDAPDVEGARQLSARLNVFALNEREAAHAAVIRMVDGRFHGTARLLDDLLTCWRPTDLLGLLMGHLLDFFVGDAENLRDRVGRSLASFDPDHPHSLRAEHVRVRSRREWPLSRPSITGWPRSSATPTTCGASMP